jgi:hypothetical protein
MLVKLKKRAKDEPFEPSVFPVGGTNWPVVVFFQIQPTETQLIPTGRSIEKGISSISHFVDEGV